MNTTSLSDQPPRIKALGSLLVVIQLVLLGAAHWDISHRSPAQLRGSKGKWRAITMISYVGPIWYFARGRR